MSSELRKFRRERDRALRSKSIGRLREIGGVNRSDEVLEISLHKARYETMALTPEERIESRRWLESRGYSRWKGIPWPPENTEFDEKIK